MYLIVHRICAPDMKSPHTCCTLLRRAHWSLVCIVYASPHGPSDKEPREHVKHKLYLNYTSNVFGMASDTTLDIHLESM